MVRSRLLDYGQERATIFPEVYVENDRGEKYKTPAKQGRTVRVTVGGERQSLAELPGQVDVKVVILVFRWPFADQIGTNSRVVFRDEEWDLSAPAHISSAASKASRHYEITIKSRNKLGGLK